MRKLFIAAAVGAATALTAAPAAAQIEIQWWHSMGGALGEWVNDLAKDFNASQKDYKVVPTFKGSYDESMTAAIAAFRAGNAPHILQVFEVGTATMMASKGAIMPVGKVMTDAGQKFDPKVYVPAVAGYYTAPNGQMLCFPFNSSTHGLLLQQGRVQGGRPRPGEAAEDLARSRAGRRQAEGRRPQVPVHHELGQLDAARELLGLAQRRRSPPRATASAASTRGWRSTRRCTCATSRTWPTWPSRACSSTRAAATRPTPTFVTGECAMITGSSALYGNVKRNAKFAFGISTLPYYPDVQGAPQNTVIGGASLWVMAGKKPAEYKGVASSSPTCRSPRSQAACHKRTGYLPITIAAVRADRQVAASTRRTRAPTSS